MKYGNLEHLHRKLKSSIKLKKVSKTDCPFLYDLLKQRDSRVNISHKKMPAYDQHVKFVMSRPYSIWYVIQSNTQSIGSIYLSNQNEIGIFLNNNMHGKGIGQKVLEMIMKKHPRSRFLANINPKNKKSIKFFTKNGFKLIQHTYEFTYSRKAR